MTEKDDHVIRAEKGTLKFSEKFTLDCFKMPNGSKRIGKSSTMRLLNLHNKYFLGLESPTSKTLKGLQDNGYRHSIVKVGFDRIGRGGASEEDTISLKDLKAIVRHEAYKKNNPIAIALLDASFDEKLEVEAEATFNEKPRSQAQRHKTFDIVFTESYAQALKDNQQDVEDSWLPGDADAYPQFGPGFSTKWRD